MTKFDVTTAPAALVGGVPRYNIFASPIGPRIVLEAPGEGGSGGGEGGAGAGAGSEGGSGEGAGNGGEGGAPKLSDKEAELLKENMKKKDEIKALKERLATFDGIEPAKVKELLDAAAKAEADKKAAELAAAQAAGDFDKVKQMMADAHKAELEAERQKIEAERAQVRTAQDALNAAMRTINDLTVGTAFSNSSFVRDELVLTPSKARVVYGDHFESENGVIVAYDKPKGAEGRTKLVDGSGTALGFEAAIKKLIDSDPDRDNLVKSKVANGAGSTTTDKKPTQKTGELKGLSRIQAALAAQQKK